LSRKTIWGFHFSSFAGPALDLVRQITFARAGFDCVNAIHPLAHYLYIEVPHRNLVVSLARPATVRKALLLWNASERSGSHILQLAIFCNEERALSKILAWAQEGILKALEMTMGRFPVPTEIYLG
jgi:hypothetical protein